MRVGIVSVFVDYHRRGGKNRLSLQPQIGPLIAALLPRDVEIEIVNETFGDVDWQRDYDLLFLSALHPDFDRARQMAHYWRRRGATTVFGGPFATSYPELCEPWFDAVAVGDPEGIVPRLYADFAAGRLARRYTSLDHDPARVPTPRFDLLAGKAHHPLCFEASRGCPFSCEFCVLTGLGTRYHPRPVADVVRDILAGQRMLADHLPAYKRRIVGFCDNNIGGHLGWLRELCAALEPLRIRWYGSATFNVIAQPELVRTMARAGCRALFVGLETFNPDALVDMRKFQNVVHKTRDALATCRRHGILIASGMLASPLADDPAYLRRLPECLDASGLRVPTFLAFETPIPGTPHFHRLAAEAEPAFLPNALLRDFAGYTLVVRPRKASAEEFVAAYREAVDATFTPARRAGKLLHDLPSLLPRGGWFPALIDVADMLGKPLAKPPRAGRTYLAGSEPAPPETVPLADADFDDERMRRALLEPTAVTDARGELLAHWRHARPVFTSRRDRLERRAVGV